MSRRKKRHKSELESSTSASTDEAASHASAADDEDPGENEPMDSAVAGSDAVPDDAGTGGASAKATGVVGSADMPTRADPPRDASQVVLTDYERRELPASLAGAREGKFQVVIRQSALNQIHRHGRSSMDIEVCGVLVGNVYHDARGAWLYIEQAIVGNDAAGRATQVTFTAQTWAQIQAVMERNFAESRMVGWYHTHPGFGIFLSDMDVFIQEHFFGEPWAVALVYDPKASEQGVFIWRGGRPEVEPLLVEDDTAVETPTTTVQKARAVPKPSPAGADVVVLAERIESLERRSKLLLVLLALAILVALAWPLAVTTFLPDLLKRTQPAPPPANMPDYSDPTNRGDRL